MHAVTIPPTAAWLPSAPRSDTARTGVTFGRRAVVLSLFLLVYCTLEVVSYTQRSATYDEPLHLAAGYAALTKRDYRMDPTHPPLVRMWAALPLLAMPDVGIDTTRMDGLSQDGLIPRQNTHAHEFLYVRNDADHLLNWSRFMIVLLGAALGLMVFRWTEEWLGFPAAAFTLLFYLLSPNLGAHASLVTTDIGVTLLYFGTIYFLWRTCRDFTAWNVTGLVLSFALAIVSKFSSLLLIPTVGALLVIAAWRPGVMTWRRAGGLVVLLGVTTWVVIWAAYGFRYTPGELPTSVLETWNRPQVAQHLPFLAPLLNEVDGWRILPNAFTQGFLLCFAWSEVMPSYLLGEISTSGGWWYYYPVAFLVKTPSTLLVLLLAGLGVIIRRRGRVGGGWLTFVLLPPAIYLGFAMTTGINLGVRHILPIYPFVLMTAALVVREILDSAWRTRTKWLVLASVAGFGVTMFAWRYPNTLSHFNLFVGGPQNGLNYLTDSNLDWGQHLKRLRKWMDKNEAGQVNLAYFGIADPAYYDINCRLLPGAQDYLAPRVVKPELPGYVAVSATVLSGVYLTPEWRLFYEGFEELEPVAVLGNSLRIYWVERWPVASMGDGEPSAEEVERHALLASRLFNLGWYEYATPYLRQFLQFRPDNHQAREALSLALLESGQSDEAVKTLQRAVERDPRSATTRHRLALLLLRQGDAPGAIEQAREIVRLLPDDARARALLGVALARDGQWEAAEKALERARQMDPDDRVILQHLEQLRQARLAPGPSQPPR